jgi:hypothetical protein
MNRFYALYVLLTLFPIFSIAQPLRLHPRNQHYFEYKGKPVVLVTSAEHYGAVLNMDFDYKKYLETLAAEGMNYTRIFAGSYVEIPGSFGIENNTLAPAVGSFIAPWQRTSEQGTYEGEMKFDLSRWNPVFFDRLKSFISEADRLDVFVEVTLFCSTYDDKAWLRHPFHPGNNVNNLGELARRESTTLKNSKLVEFQKAFVEKIVKELNDYDNFFWELQNEPWADNGVRGMRILKTHNISGQNWAQYAELAKDGALEWQKEIARVIAETESRLPKQHLIAQNYCNFKESLAEVMPNISIINFHYAWPDAVRMNYGWNRPIGFDESGFTGSDDETYLLQAWEFMAAGGALFNNLDYSFFVGHEDGKGISKAPGGGSTRLRSGLKILREFIESFDFVKMSPDVNVVFHSPGMEWQAISEPGKQYAIVFSGKNSEHITFYLPKGKYLAEYIDPWTGKVFYSETLQSQGKPISSKAPVIHGFAGCRLVAQK